MPEARVLLAGGGTAGHVNPLLAVARELRSRGVKVAVLGTAQGLEAQLVPEAGFQLFEIPRVPFPRRPSAEVLRLPGNLRRAIEATEIAVASSKANVVMGFGGYVSAPAYWVCYRQGIPLMIHEQNARPGLANRLGARWAQVVALTFAGTNLRAGRGETVVTGLPLRPEIQDLAGLLDPTSQGQGPETSQTRPEPAALMELRRQARQALGLDPDKPTLLITGGSLGALNLNETMMYSAQTLPADWQVLHLTGKGKDEPVVQAVAQAGLEHRYHVQPYLPQMEWAYSLASFVVCRSGAGTVAELSALGLPACFVPLPIGNGEQRFNALGQVDKGGALLVDDADFTPEYVESRLWPLLADSARLQAMAAAAVSTNHLQAAARIADLMSVVWELDND